MNFEKVKELCNKKVHLTIFGVCTQDIPYSLAHPGFFTLTVETACDSIDSDHEAIQKNHEKAVSDIESAMKEKEIYGYFKLKEHNVKLMEREVKFMNRDGFYPKIIITKLFINLDDTFFNQTEEEAAKTLVTLSKILNKMPKVYDEWKANQED